MRKASKSTDILFEEKIARNGRRYFQGCGDHSNVFLFREHEAKKNGRVVWRMTVKTPVRS